MCSTTIRANARQLSLASLNPPTDVNTQKVLTKPLDLAQILQGNPAILGPIHREVQLLHQPLTLI